VTDGQVHCAKEGCVAAHPNHRWGKTKAHTDGWFEQRDGKRWCPKHVPAWVAGWRERKGKR
jgi:hypothetical protein